MNNLSNCSAVCKIKSLCKSLWKMQFKSNYSVDIGIYRDTDCDEPSCSHAIRGSVECKITKLIAGIAVVSLVMSMLCALFSCIRN